MVKGVASLHSGSQTGGSKKPGARKFAPFNKLSEQGNRVDGKGTFESTLLWEKERMAERRSFDVELRVHSLLPNGFHPSKRDAHLSLLSLGSM